jgi:hypothetical protein
MSNKVFSLVITGFIIFIAGCAAIDNKTEQQGKLRLTRLFPDKQSDQIKFDAKVRASPLLDLSQGKPRIIVPVSDGMIALQDAETGVIKEKIQLPLSSAGCKRIEISATPTIIGINLVVVYQCIEGGRRTSHHRHPQPRSPTHSGIDNSSTTS